MNVDKGCKLKKKKAPQSPIKSALVKVIGHAPNEVTALHRFFSNLSTKEIYQSFPFIAKSPQFTNSINLTKKTPISDMYMSRISMVEMSKNLSWCLSLIEHHASAIRKYQLLRQDLDHKILLGEHEDCFKILDEIDASCGVSIWAHITRCSIESFLAEEQKSQNRNVFESVKDNYFLKYVVFYATSYFTDPEIFFTSRNTHVNDIKRSVNEDLKDFFLYKFFRLDTTFKINFEGIFDVEKNSSLIDIYQLVIFSIEYVKVQGLNFDEVFNYRLSQVINTLERTGYNYLDCIKSSCGYKYEVDAHEEEYLILDKYTEGKYSYVVSACLESNIILSDFSFAELTAKSLARVEVEIGKSFIAKILYAMKDVLIKSSRYDVSLGYLACLSNSFRTIEWFKQLGYFVERESKNRSIEVITSSEVGMYLFSRTYTPKKVVVFDDTDAYVVKLKESYQDSSSLYLLGYNKTQNTDLSALVDDNRLSKYRALSYIEKGNFECAEEVLLALIKSSDDITRIESLGIYSNLLIQLCKFECLLDLVVDHSIEGDKLFSIFDTNKILSSIEGHNFKTKNIELPIVYALHSQHVNSNFDSNLKFSFENFITSNGFRFPTELFGKEPLFSQERISYFLRLVCTPEIMKLYLEFNTFREIEECRLKICNYLLDKNQNTDDLQFEIKNISKNLIIRKAVQQVENSRIYVDTAIFKGRNSAPYKTLFDRYLELSSKSSEVSNDDSNFNSLIEVLNRKGVSDKDYWKTLSVVFMPDVKLSPKNATFLSIVKLMRQEFTYGEKGINNYLSTRIRHGVLPTALRRSPMRECIYVSQTASVTSYRDSLNNDSNIQLRDEEFDEFLPIAKKFTKHLEDEISLFNDRKLQIYTLESPLDKNEKSQGMFNYSVSPIETYAIQSELPPSPSYEDLVKVVTNWLWHKTDYILDEVKDYIATTFHSTLNEKFDSFISDIQNSSISQLGKRNLANAVSRAKASISNDINTIGSWFEHVDSDGDGEFELSTAVEIAKRSLDINLEYTETLNHKLPQRNVSYWVDVLFILFENAISKSNLDRNEVIIILKVTMPNEENLVLECTNNTSHVDDMEIENKNLDFYKEAYGDEELTRDAIQSEGGTGFFKIWKIVTKDLGIKHQIDFGYTDSDSFFVNLSLETKVG